MTTPDIGLDRARLAALRAREDAAFEARIPRSLALRAEGRAVMPNGVPMGWMAGLYRHPPLTVTKGEGAHFEDVDGNRYLDMNQADLSMNCGFGPPAVTAAVAARMRDGSSFLLPTEDAIAVSRLLGERFGLPCWQYTLSASSANAEAIRVARVATGREKVLLFGGKYHGHIDDTLVKAFGSGTGPELLGLPRAAAERAVVVPFNDLDALRAALRGGDIACVITEPALTNIGVVLPEPGFLAAAKAETTAAGALFILDETHTHMAAYGGLTRAWQLEADMVSLGKSLGGGVAIGAYGMTRALADVMERHLDVDVGAPGLAVGGTLYANALSLAAARAALEQVLTPAGYAHVQALGKQLADGIDALIARHGLPWKAHRLGGRSGFCLRPHWPRNAEEGGHSIDVAFIDARRVFMANRGVWEAIATAGPAASFAHTAGDIERYLDVLAAFLVETAG
ncbi:MAG: aminotransferase class III-fold pyridoxal phosphate-dependent enzyme [Kiloniellales bacterium]